VASRKPGLPAFLEIRLAPGWLAHIAFTRKLATLRWR